MGDLLLWGCGFGIIMKSFLRNPREWRYRLTVRTEPSQGLNRGSIPLSATNKFPMNRKLLLCWLSLGLLAGGDDKFWEKQDSANWTPEQVTQFVTSSPWAKQTTAVLTSNDSNMAANTPRSGGGGGRRGAVYSSRGSSDSTPNMPKFQAIVRWLNAPMKKVLKSKLPGSFQGHYVISVTGLPVGEEAAGLAEQTTLQLKRGDSVHPEIAYQDPNDTATVYFAFLPSMVETNGGKTATFTMLAAPFEIKVKFNLAEMKIHGEPSF